MISVCTFLDNFNGRAFFIDNAALVDIINKQTSKHTLIMEIVQLALVHVRSMLLL